MKKQIINLILVFILALSVFACSTDERKCGICKGSGECTNCFGTGIVSDYSGSHECSWCEGTGKCKDCMGTGKR